MNGTPAPHIIKRLGALALGLLLVVALAGCQSSDRQHTRGFGHASVGGHAAAARCAGWVQPHPDGSPYRVHVDVWAWYQAAAECSSTGHVQDLAFRGPPDDSIIVDVRIYRNGVECAQDTATSGQQDVATSSPSCTYLPGTYHARIKAFYWSEWTGFVEFTFATAYWTAPS